jgi:hypothetical protein
MSKKARTPGEPYWLSGALPSEELALVPAHVLTAGSGTVPWSRTVSYRRFDPRCLARSYYAIDQQISRAVKIIHSPGVEATARCSNATILRSPPSVIACTWSDHRSIALTTSFA